MIHRMKLQSSPFEKIRTGRKTIELRLWDEKRQGIRPGDEIEFTDLGDPGRCIRATVVKLHRFDSFRELYGALDLEKCGYAPGETADPGDMELYYSPEAQRRYGVVGIELADVTAI